MTHAYRLRAEHARSSQSVWTASWQRHSLRTVSLSNMGMFACADAMRYADTLAAAAEEELDAREGPIDLATSQSAAAGPDYSLD